jgi:hypothetical protein
MAEQAETCGAVANFKNDSILNLSILVFDWYPPVLRQSPALTAQNTTAHERQSLGDIVVL